MSKKSCPPLNSELLYLYGQDSLGVKQFRPEMYWIYGGTLCVYIHFILYAPKRKCWDNLFINGAKLPMHCN